jgi:hypothetical protein
MEAAEDTERNGQILYILKVKTGFADRLHEQCKHKEKGQATGILPSSL